MSRKIKQNYSKWFLTKVKHAVLDFKMIEDGDRIAVGVSGGKDSGALLFILTLLKKWSNFNFELQPISLDLGFGADFSPVQEFCNEEELPYHIEKTKIGKIVFDVKKEKNPCALCANMRRGALNKAALELGCNKVALGHHLDDAIETFFLNLCYTAHMTTFAPKTYLSRTDLWVIRPMVYLKEEKISAITRKEELPVVPNPCPVGDMTKRKEMKELVKTLQNKHPRIRERFLSAFLNTDGTGFWKP